MMRKNQFNWTIVLPGEKFSKQYKTYMGAFKAAQKIYPFDTDRMIRKITPQGQIKTVFE